MDKNAYQDFNKIVKKSKALYKIRCNVKNWSQLSILDITVIKFRVAILPLGTLAWVCLKLVLHSGYEFNNSSICFPSLNLNQEIT